MLLVHALLATVSPVPKPIDAAARVKSWLAPTPDAPDAIMLPEAACAENIHFTGDLPGASLRGVADYSAASCMWRSDCAELLGPRYTTTVLRVAQLSSDEVTVRWRAEWSPESITWIESLAGVARWEIDRFDLDPTTVSSFSWLAVGELFSKAALTGRIALPTASVEGLATLRLDRESGLCIAHRECVMNLMNTQELVQPPIPRTPSLS